MQIRLYDFSQNNPTNYRITVSAVIHAMNLKSALKELNFKRGIIFR